MAKVAKLPVKPFGFLGMNSNTYRGLVILIIPMILRFAGVADETGELTSMIVDDIVLPALMLIGAVWTVIGRAKASTKLATKKQVEKLNKAA